MKHGMADTQTGTNPALQEIVRAICADHGNRPDALIEILHDVQGGAGCVPEDAIPVLAECLNLSRADVHGVVTFYHDFRRTPAGRHEIALCLAEACQANGCDGLADHVRSRLGVDMGETTADGAFTLKAVYCLGNCALGPSVMIDGALHARVDADRFDALLAEATSGRVRP